MTVDPKSPHHKDISPFSLSFLSFCCISIGRWMLAELTGNPSSIHVSQTITVYALHVCIDTGQVLLSESGKGQQNGVGEAQ